MSNGLKITLTGPAGCGKTNLLGALVKIFDDSEIPVIATDEVDASGKGTVVHDTSKKYSGDIIRIVAKQEE